MTAVFWCLTIFRLFTDNPFRHILFTPNISGVRQSGADKAERVLVGLWKKVGLLDHLTPVERLRVTAIGWTIGMALQKSNGLRAFDRFAMLVASARAHLRMLKIALRSRKSDSDGR